MKIRKGIIGGIGLLLAMVALQSCSTVRAGPNGGDIVPLGNGQAMAEVMSNSDTGEVMVHTWDKNLKSGQPIENHSLMMGSGSQTVELKPYPESTDTSGLCSRFYGQADWMRGGQTHHGWLSANGDKNRHDFDMNNCWNGGAAHGSMFTGMGDHRHGMMGGASGSGMGH